MEHIKPLENFDGSCYYDDQNKIRFRTPVYEQRYFTVFQILTREFFANSFKKIIDFGCADMKFFKILKRLSDVERLLLVDMDEDLLTEWMYSIQPQFGDYTKRRPHEFRVEVWRGSVAQPHECLEGTDVVIGIELIEHLFPSVLEEVPQNVFGFIRPKVAMFSTPNSEYNVLFDALFPSGFRHEDHKFEWTRAQFQEWCQNICLRFSDYTVKYLGIGPPPNESMDIGCVSQLAVFVRKDFLEGLNFPKDEQTENDPGASAPVEEEQSTTSATNGCTQAEVLLSKMYFNEEMGEIVMMSSEDQEEANAADQIENPEVFRDAFEESPESPEVDSDEADGDDDQPRIIDCYMPVNRARNDSGNYDDEQLDPTCDEYKLLLTVDYPVEEPDPRTRSQRLLDDAGHQIRILKFRDDEFYDYERGEHLIPLQTVVDRVTLKTETTLEELRPILVGASYRISDDNIINVSALDESPFGSEEDFEYDYNQAEGDDEVLNDVNRQPEAMVDDEDELWE
ncbi:uncharacterized protein LOC129768117 [Toxorhynchites rutilus septentrionalis]|uniref:uncharacterized protein LOC129768117 n=1 Tax=Toxorhynchites rutilus septentrionalis TaxID=329112 RepID=UPI0024797A8A|nr:uncharacterized protein LOC129768117 [Toxorhynchites rutilus septentrionalis]